MVVAIQQLVVGVVLAPGLDRPAPWIDQFGVGPFAVGDRVPGGNQLVDELAQVVVGVGLKFVQVSAHRVLHVG